MNTDTLRDVLGECREHLCQQLQTQRVRELIAGIDAALAESEQDHLADAGKMIAAPRQLAPGETPKVEGYYWATWNDGLGMSAIVRVYTNGEKTRLREYGDGRDWPTYLYTDFFGPLTDPRDARATLQTLHTPAAAFGSSEAGKKGGAARAEKLSSEERSAIAKRAAQARWAASKSSDKPPKNRENS